MAVKLLACCETGTLLVDRFRCLLDLGPDHQPSPSGFLRLVDGTRLKQLTVKLVDPLRWGSDTIVRRCHSLMGVMDVSIVGLSHMLVESQPP